MFVPRAHVYLERPNKKSWFSGASRPKSSQPKHKVNLVEYVRMPCLIPTFVGTIVGFMIICGGTVLCLMGYNPGKFLGYSAKTTNILNPNISSANITEPTLLVSTAPEIPNLKVLTYIGPVFMGIGFFVMMVAVVLYCEIKDKYVTHILPDRDVKQLRKDELYDMIISEFRKNYFRGIEVPLKPKTDLKENPIEKELPTLFKALSISTPALLITPEMQRKWRDRDRVMSISVPISAKQVERVRVVPIAVTRRESWLKTSSLPNIRPKGAIREAMRASKKSKSQFVNHREISKSFQENISNLTTTKEGPGCDNPAFRDSPTETIKLTQIGPILSPDSPVFSHGTHLTKVQVHMEASQQDNMQDYNSADARGYTLRRDSIQEDPCEQQQDVSDSPDAHIPQGYRCSSPDACSVVIDADVSPEDVVIDCDSKELLLGKPAKHELTRVKSLYNLSEGRDYKVDPGQVGPYKTCIGIFRSESCLDQLRNHYVDVDDDASSDDSLTLTDDVMKYFDKTDLLPV
ncbi:uncharacterized protein LOC110442167 [Mizuhopecten yessoensis]|uniref:Uncharacterized protein n=1 Tax=Mizuhopecten yessoensis TaxID=6573 RepID=A0A210PHT7_MIZYE|nr:uncharacterized protein LOC110442167 [Mizuhopecten yessoensis]XP_021341313.1 uncharacterized protein LOC110442167 [Mizuhopecten yessoensis]XP_021341314.1 uncharacterized protein LOC110442167 [Mizuhopecten yessoensis]XP_021341315.1 uncharacterized protein LOC110442167 [Mizuhopecten yessoensis]XP_021341316.1 uncharacterized protein LOC110442167 [Mizuhopecten yessoensis]OWF36055.1 hypothetical protein KP79_PYT22247 [Mizuhopecten yessoensis]